MRVKTQIKAGGIRCFRVPLSRLGRRGVTAQRVVVQHAAYRNRCNLGLHPRGFHSNDSLGEETHLVYVPKLHTGPLCMRSVRQP